MELTVLIYLQAVSGTILMLLMVIISLTCKFEPDLSSLSVKVVAWLSLRSCQIIDNSRQSVEILGIVFSISF